MASRGSGNFPTNGGVIHHGWTLWRYSVVGDIAEDVLFEQGASGVSISVPAADITIAAQTPAVASGKSVAAPAANITVAGHAPSIAAGVNVSAPSVDIQITALAPNVRGGFVTITPPAANINIEAHAPSISATEFVRRGGGWIETKETRRARRDYEKQRREAWKRLEADVEEAYADATGQPRKVVKPVVKEALAPRDPEVIRRLAERLASSPDPAAADLVQRIEARLAEIEAVSELIQQIEYQRTLDDDDAVMALLLAA